jgi:ubiquitin thioesterase protein OTUB1
MLLCIHLPVPCSFVRQIEPMNRESDSLQIVCLSNLLGVGVRVAYLDQSAAAESSTSAAAAADSMRTYDFPEGSRPRVHLLYRPGHYDVLTVAASAAAQ